VRESVFRTNVGEEGTGEDGPSALLRHAGEGSRRSSGPA
jgi:hypothetical protein